MDYIITGAEIFAQDEENLLALLSKYRRNLQNVSEEDAKGKYAHAFTRLLKEIFGVAMQYVFHMQIYMAIPYDQTGLSLIEVAKQNALEAKPSVKQSVLKIRSSSPENVMEEISKIGEECKDSFCNVYFQKMASY